MRTSLPASMTVLLAVALLGGSCFPELPLGTPGRRDFQSSGRVPVPGAVFNAAALNTHFEHLTLSVDTKLGPRKTFARVYDTGTRAWRASWETHFDGATFVDPHGGVYDVASLPPGSAIPGSIWVLVDADTVRTKGGLVFDFGADGRLASEHWSFAAFPQLSYLWSDDELRVEECVSSAQQQSGQCRPIVSVVYGPHGATEVIDEVAAAAGETRRAAYAYDPQGRLQEAWTPRQRAQSLRGTRYEYGAADLISAQTLPDDERIEYTYAQTHLLEVRPRGAGDPVYRFDYASGQAGGWEVLYRAPLGGRTRFAVTSEGEITSIERLDLPVPERMTIDWHAGLHRPSRIRYFDGTQREFPSWSDDDPTAIVEPSGNTLRLVYAPDAVNFAHPTQRAIASMSDDLGPVASYAYGGSGLPQSRSNGEGEVTRFEYLAGNLVRVTWPWGGEVEIQSFGASGHWLEARLSAFPDVVIRRAFDRVGNPVVASPGARMGGCIGQTHDRDRRLRSLEVAATDDAGAVTSQAVIDLLRDASGRLQALERPLGADHALEYDELGRLMRRRERVDGAWQDTRFEHDLEGRVTAVERPNGMREEFDYDPYGRITARRALRNGALEGEVTFRWESGRLLEAYDSLRDQTETLDYDAAGRPRSLRWSARGELLIYEYDARSRITREIYLFDGLVRLIGSEWDLADRRVRRFTLDASGAQQDLVRNAYADGRLVSVAHGNGLLRERLFDPDTQRLVGFRTTDPTGRVVEESSFGSAVAANPMRLEISTQTSTDLASTREVYWLDAGGSLQTPEGRLGRRVFRWQGWRDGSLEAQESYAWDGLGNPMDDSDGDVFVYNAERNRLLSARTGGISHVYAYDEAGFVVERDGLPLEWTATGRLRRVGSAGNPLVEIRWDMAGRVISIGALGQAREFALFGGRVEYDPLTRTPGQLEVAAVSLPFAGDARRYRHFDALGNLSFASDETGSVIVHKRYRAFGVDAVYGDDDFGRGEARGFAGGIGLRHRGVETGLVVMGERILDSDVGRFLSQDPLLQPGGQYGYAEGNPVEKLDVDGREAVPKAASQAMAEVFGAGADELESIAADATFAATAFGFAAGVAALTGNAPVATAFGAATLGAGLVAGTAGLLGSALRAAQAASQPPRPPALSDPPQQKDLELAPDPKWLTTALQNLANLAPLSHVEIRPGGSGGCSPAAGVADPMRFGRRWLGSSLLLGLLLCLRVAAAMERRPAGGVR